MTRHALGFVLVSFLAAALPAQVTWWDKDFAAALTAAKDKPAGVVLLYCWQDDHGNCQAMFDGTMSDKQVSEPMTDFLCMGIRNDDAGKETWARYKIQTVPTVLFVDPDGAIVDSVIGYDTIVDFAATLKRVRDGAETIPALQKEVDAGTATLPQMQLLMQKLQAIQEHERARKVIDAMIEKDPKGRSEEAAEAQLWKISAETFRDGIAPQDLDLGPLRRFLKSQRNKRVLFLGYDRMATAHWSRAEAKDAASYANKAWKSIPDDRVVEWGQRMCRFAYGNWKDLDKANKRILKDALKVSKATLKAVEKRHAKQPDKAFYANAMSIHASILIVNKKRKEALDLMEEAITLDPNNKNLKTWRDKWLSGDK